jgi:autotransporter translocation and assembly factor TamB
VFISIPLIILLLGIVGYFYISSDSFLNNFIKPRLEKALQKQVNEKYTVTFGELSGNIFTGVEVENFRIEDNKKLSILSTDGIVLKYYFWGLLQRKFLVTALEINSPELNLWRNSEGQVNLTQVFRESSQDSDASFAFAISKAEINGGKILFTDTQQNIELSLPDIDITLEGKLEKWDHKGKLSIGKGSFILNGTELPIEELKNINFSVSAKNSTLEKLKLQLGNSYIEIQELNGNFGERKWNTLVALTIDARDVQMFLGDNTQLAGLGKVVLDLNGTDSTLNGKLVGTSEALSIKQFQDSQTDSSKSLTRQVDITNLEIDTSLNLRENPQLTFDGFSAQVAGGKLSGSGSVTFENNAKGNLIERLQHLVRQPITYNGNCQITDVQFHSLFSMFGDLSEQIPQIESGAFSGSVQVKGDTTGNFHIESDVKLSDTNFLVKDESIPLKNSSLNCLISSESGNGSSIRIDGTIDDTSVDIGGSFDSLDVQLENIDFGKLFRILNSIPFKGIGSITAQIKDGTAIGHVEMPETFYCHSDDEPIPLGRLAGNFRYVDRVVYFENAHLTKQGGTSVSIEGDIGIDGKLPANFRIIANPLVLDADYNKLFFTVAYPIEGDIKGELNLYGQLIDHLDGSGNFVIDSGNAWSINFDPATFQFEIDDYSLTIPNFVITTRGQQVILNVHVESNGDFNFSIKNSKDKPIQLAELARAAEITDFPLDGKMGVNVESHQKKTQDLVFTTKFIFTDLTFEDNPLGDAHLDGILIEEKNHFKFTGKALAGTTDIEGTISNALPNPYKFFLKSEKTAAAPILRIFHPALDAITGTIDSTVEVEGTITELVEPTKNSVHPYDVDIVINQTLLQYNSLHFTNPKTIRLNLEDDVLTISDSSLSVDGGKSPFIQLTGTIDTKTEEIDLSSKHNQILTLESLGTALGFPISGNVQYDLKTKGTLGNPIVELKWTIPMLIAETEIGDISVSDANGEIKLQNNTLQVKPFQMLVLDNPFQIGGNIVIDENEFNNSKLNFEIISENLDLAKFSDLVRNSLSVETVKRLTFDKSALIQGNIGAMLNVAGTVAEPVVDLNTHTIANHPIRLGAFAEPIVLDKLHALTTIRRESIQIQDLIADGQIGKGIFQINGKTSFSTKNNDEMTYDLDLYVEKLEVGNFVTFFQQYPSPLSGTVSGLMKLSGTGFNSDLLAANCKVNELNLQAHGYRIYNTLPIDFKLENNSVTTLLPLQIESPALGCAVNIGFNGPLAMPNITAKWQGTFKHPLKKAANSPLQWDGNIEYANKQIKLRTELTTNGDNLILNGTIPFDLTLTEIDFSERFLDMPINARLTGKELPLSFFPSFDAVFSEVEGVADIDLKLQGTTRTPYLEGNVFFQAPHLRLKNFSQPFENLTVQLDAHKGAIEFAMFQFEIEEGTCNLEQSELELDGLTPKSFSAKGLSIKQYPLGTILRQVLPQNYFEDVNGSVAATLTELNIPLDNFFENDEKFPIPKLGEKTSFDALTQVATADFTIDNIFLGFTATTLDQQFIFENPEPILITLANSGTFRINNGIKLENTVPISSDIAEDPLVFSCFGRWNMQGEMSANLKLDNFNISILDPLLPDVFREAYQKKGMLSATIDITDTYAAPEITVKCVGHKLAINRAKIDEFYTELRYSPDHQQWTISDDKPILRFGKNQLTCSGRVPYLISFSKLQAKPLPEVMLVEIDCELDELEILPLMEPLIQSASGIGSINATVSGTPQTPRLKGEGNFAGLKLTSSPVFFENANAQFNFTESKLEIKTIEGQLNNGEFSARGEIGLNWLEIDDINLEASLTDCTFIEPRLYQINMNSDELRLHGKMTDMILEGHIKIDSGHYRQDWNWEDVLNIFSAGTVREADLFSYAPILRELDLDIGIDIPNNFHLRSSTGGNTDIEIACSGQITGAIQEPLFTGNVSILKGKIAIITQVFEIVEDSTIRNSSTTTFNPELNIFLEIPNPIRGVLLRDGSTADLKITATLTGILENGDIDKAKLNFHAEPLNSSTTEFFTEADVLALLLPGNFFSRSFGGITFTISSGLDPNERHIIAEYPLPRNMSIKVEGDEKGDVGVDVQLLERRF